MRCYRHPKEETELCCGKCDRPICTRCMVQGPAGVRCPECASLKSNPLYRIDPLHFAFGVAVALILGLAGCIVYRLAFISLIVAPIYGGFVGDMVLRASGRKQNRLLVGVTIGCMALGGLAALAPDLPALLAPGSGAQAALAGLSLRLVWVVIGLALSISACYARLRYL